MYTRSLDISHIIHISSDSWQLNWNWTTSLHRSTSSGKTHTPNTFLWLQAPFLSFETTRTLTIIKKQFYVLVRFLIESCGLMKLSLCLWWCLNTCNLTLREQKLRGTCSLLLLCLNLPCGQRRVSFSASTATKLRMCEYCAKCHKDLSICLFHVRC